MFKKKQGMPKVKKPKVKGSEPLNVRKVMTSLGIIFILSSASLFAWYEFFGGRQFLHYEDIVVANEPIKQGQVFQAENLTTMQVEKAQLAEGAILDPNEVIGQQANHFIPQYAQLDRSYLSENGLVLKKGQVISQIPREWILSVPDTLRRGDDIVLYSAFYDTELLAQLQKKQTATSNSDKSDTNTAKNPASVTSGQPSEFEQLLQTKVAYVKDGANREVVTVSNGDRIDGSSVIGSVEIITTAEEFEKIEEKIQLGHRFVLMYTNAEIETAEGTSTDKESTEDVPTEADGATEAAAASGS